MLDLLLGSLPQLFAQTDSVFTDSRLNAVENKLQDIHVRANAKESATIDLLFARVVPFGIQTIAQGLWGERFSPPFNLANVQNIQTATTSDTITQEVIGCVHWEHTHAAFHSRLVSRRYESEDRVVIVSTGLSDPLRTSSMSLDGIMFRMTDWMIVEKPRHPQLQAQGVHAAQMHRRRLATVYAYNQSRSQANLAQVVDNVLKGVKGNLDMGDQAIDNILLNKQQTHV